MSSGMRWRIAPLGERSDLLLGRLIVVAVHSGLDVDALHADTLRADTTGPPRRDGELRDVSLLSLAMIQVCIGKVLPQTNRAKQGI